MTNKGMTQGHTFILYQFENAHRQRTCWRFAGGDQGFPSRGDFSIKRKFDTERICSRTTSNSNQGTQCDNRREFTDFWQSVRINFQIIVQQPTSEIFRKILYPNIFQKATIIRIIWIKKRPSNKLNKIADTFQVQQIEIKYEQIDQESQINFQKCFSNHDILLQIQSAIN